MALTAAPIDAMPSAYELAQKPFHSLRSVQSTHRVILAAPWG
jgi:hypothetical protein